MKARKLGACFAVIAGVAAAAVTATAGPAVAAAAVDVSVQTGAATLRPAADGGYAGTMDVDLRYTGPDGASLQFEVVAPEGFYLQVPPGSDLIGCGFGGRYTSYCGVDGQALSDGETRRLRLDFTALAAPTAETRQSLVGSVTATVSIFGEDVVESTPADNTAEIRGALAGTGGGEDPEPYRPATTYDVSATATDVTFAPGTTEAGGHVGTVSMTLHAATDAYQQNLIVTLLPGEYPFEYMEIEPSGACVGGSDGWSCLVEGGQVAQGERRTVTVRVHSAELPPAGTEIHLRADTNIGGVYAEDATPADNTVTVPVS